MSTIFNNFFPGILKKWSRTRDGKDSEIQSGQQTSTIPNNLSPSRVTSIQSLADTGSASDQARYILAMQDSDPILSAHIQTRKLAVQSCQWIIENENPETAGALTDRMKKLGINALISHLLDAIPTGYAGALQYWNSEGVSKWAMVHPSQFSFNSAGKPIVRSQMGTGVELFGEFEAGTMILYTPSSKPGIPSTQGLGRVLMTTWLRKQIAQMHLNRFLEKFGSPFRHIKMSNESYNDIKIREGVCMAARRMGNDGFAVTSEDTEIEFTSQSQEGADSYFTQIQQCDNAYALTLLGQLASSGEASGMSNGQMQENVRNDIRDADCQGLTECLTLQVLHPLEHFLFGTTDSTFTLKSKQGMADA